MTGRNSGGDPRLSLAEGFERSGVSLEETWADYLAMGGTASREQVVGALHGDDTLEWSQHNRLAAALNEHFVDAGENHPVAYRDPPPEADIG